MRSPGLKLLLTLTGIAVTSPALAQTNISECANVYVESQVLEKSGKYMEAAKKALGCSKPVCGDALSAECARLYESVLASTPSVVLGAKDPNDNDLTQITVLIDGTVVQQVLDGTPVHLNPGNHVFRFEGKGLPVVEKSFSLRAGEKLRVVTVTMGEKPPTPAALLPLPPPPPPKGPSAKTLRWGALVAGILGAAGAGVGVGMYELGMGKYDTLKKACDPNRCTRAVVDGDDSHIFFTSSYVGFGVGIAGALAGGSLLLMSFDKASVRVSPQGTGFEIVGVF